MQRLQAVADAGQQLDGVGPRGMHDDHAGHDVAFGTGIFREARDDDVGERQHVDGGKSDAARIEQQLGSMLVAERAKRRDVRGLELRVIRHLGEHAGDGSRRQEAFDGGEVADVGDEVVLRVARLLEETGRVDVKPAELDPGKTTTRTLHGVDGGDAGIDGVHAGGGNQDVIGGHT